MQQGSSVQVRHSSAWLNQLQCLLQGVWMSRRRAHPQVACPAQRYFNIIVRGVLQCPKDRFPRCNGPESRRFAISPKLCFLEFKTLHNTRSAGGRSRETLALIHPLPLSFNLIRVHVFGGGRPPSSIGLQHLGVSAYRGENIWAGGSKQLVGTNISPRFSSRYLEPFGDEALGTERCITSCPFCSKTPPRPPASHYSLSKSRGPSYWPAYARDKPTALGA